MRKWRRGYARRTTRRAGVLGELGIKHQRSISRSISTYTNAFSASVVFRHSFRRAEFLADRRSNVESTFSAIKRKFGDFVRSKTHVAQVNEVFC